MRNKEPQSTEIPAQRAIVLLPLSFGERDVRDPELRLAEASGLARALDLDVLRAEAVPLRRIHPGSYFGAGRIAELKAELIERAVEVLVVDAAL